MKALQVGKEETKLSLFAVNIIIYVENPKELTKKEKTTLWDLIRKYSKVVEYKVNIQRSNIFLYARNEGLEFEIYTNTFHGSTKKKKKRTKEKNK